MWLRLLHALGLTNLSTEEVQGYEAMVRDHAFVMSTSMLWGRAWVFRRFGVPGLIVLACASAALFAGTQWDKVSNWPGVRAIVEYASRESVPKDDLERFSVVANLITLRRNLVQPGLMIDARGAEIKIDVDPTLPRGTILLVDKSGAKLYEPDQLTDPAELARVLAGAMSK